MPLLARTGRDNFFHHLSSYLMASILGTGAHYLVLFALVRAAGLGPVAASTCGAVVGAVIIYGLSYFVVFKSSQRHFVSMTRFFLVAGLGVFLNSAVLKFLTSVLPWHYLLLQVMTTLTVFAGNFILNRQWTFAQSPLLTRRASGENA